MFKFPCAVRSGLIAVVLVGATYTTTRAAVTTIGDVIPIDNVATGAVEGIPSAGNQWNALEANNAQSRWENSSVVPGGDYATIQAGIVVGQKLAQGGKLTIDSNSALRYQTLVIGDQGLVGGLMRVGTGTVLITGVGALYSNVPYSGDPSSLPPGLPSDYAATPATARALDVGFDLYVGRFGQGTLELRDGGRSEIQDAVIVGDNPGSTGVVVVDGFGSLLASGGFDSSGGPVGVDAHQLIVGRHGLGIMTIRNAGTVVSESVAGGGSDETVIAAVIGSDVFLEGDIPEPGGDGEVTVTGANSKWIIGGSLQIGGFHDSLQGMLQDVSGVNAQYNSEAGVGDLYVSDGGFVNIRPAIEADPTQDDLQLLIGRFGRLILSNGTVSIGNPGTREDNVQLLNDGVISGTGRIETGVFRNRYLGEVRVDAGQSLVIASSSEFVNTAQDLQPLSNFGVMRVLGTEDQRAQLEIERPPNTDLDPIQPFRNLRVERPMGAPLADFYGGLISAQHATLHFRSNIENLGMMAFTAGDNYVTGHVINVVDPAFPADPGIIVFRGPDTKVVFENDLICGVGICDLGPGVTVDVLARHSFITAGDLRISLNPTNPTHITSAGDVGIAGKLTVSLSGFTPGSLSIGDSFEIISFAGALGGVDLSDPLRPLVDLTAPGLFTQIQVPNLVSLGLPASAVLLPIYTSNSVLLSILSIGIAVGPDFNGDGVVDALDLAIWKANKGITMGGTVLQGDANGDGAVDGADYLIWLEEFTMGPGSGGGGFESPSSGTVPEPTGLALLAIGGLLASAFRRRRG